MSDNEKKEPVEANDFSTNDNDITPEKESLESAVEMENTHKNEPKGSENTLESELQEQKDKYVRLFAEFDNYKRRTSKEKMDLMQTAGKDLILSLLEVLDDIDRAEEQMQNSTDVHLKEGVQLVFNKFKRILASKGLKAIDTIDTDFDVEKDEAISEVPVDDEKLKGKVIAEVQKGYLLNNHLIRYAKVVVGK